MSAFLVLQFGMAAASVHCCQNGKLYALRQLCTSLFYFQNLCSLPGMAVDPGRPCTIRFFPHFLPISILGENPPGKCWVARWASQIACSDAAGWRGCGLTTWDFRSPNGRKLEGEEPWGESAKTWTLGKPKQLLLLRKHSWLWCLVLFWFWYTDIYCMECST